jgi:anaerobic ribonucleoside-triphosphate reductase
VKMTELLSIQTEQLETAKRMKGLNAGGDLCIIELGSAEYPADALLNLTLRLMENPAIDFFTYNRQISVCDNCKKNFYGTLHKCPGCGSMSTLTTFDRFTST